MAGKDDLDDSKGEEEDFTVKPSNISLSDEEAGEIIKSAEEEVELEKALLSSEKDKIRRRYKHSREFDEIKLKMLKFLEKKFEGFELTKRQKKKIYKLAESSIRQSDLPTSQPEMVQCGLLKKIYGKGNFEEDRSIKIIGQDYVSFHEFGAPYNGPLNHFRAICSVFSFKNKKKGTQKRLVEELTKGDIPPEKLLDYIGYVEKLNKKGLNALKELLHADNSNPLTLEKRLYMLDSEENINLQLMDRALNWAFNKDDRLLNIINEIRRKYNNQKLPIREIDKKMKQHQDVLQELGKTTLKDKDCFCEFSRSIGQFPHLSLGHTDKCDLGKSGLTRRVPVKSFEDFGKLYARRTLGKLEGFMNGILLKRDTEKYQRLIFLYDIYDSVAHKSSFKEMDDNQRNTFDEYLKRFVKAFNSALEDLKDAKKVYRESTRRLGKVEKGSEEKKRFLEQKEKALKGASNFYDRIEFAKREIFGEKLLIKDGDRDSLFGDKNLDQSAEKKISSSEKKEKIYGVPRLIQGETFSRKDLCEKLLESRIKRMKPERLSLDKMFKELEEENVAGFFFNKEYSRIAPFNGYEDLLKIFHGDFGRIRGNERYSKLNSIIDLYKSIVHLDLYQENKKSKQKRIKESSESSVPPLFSNKKEELSERDKSTLKRLNESYDVQGIPIEQLARECCEAKTPWEAILKRCGEGVLDDLEKYVEERFGKGKNSLSRSLKDDLTGMGHYYSLNKQGTEVSVGIDQSLENILLNSSEACFSMPGGNYIHAGYSYILDPNVKLFSIDLIDKDARGGKDRVSFGKAVVLQAEDLEERDERLKKVLLVDGVLVNQFIQQNFPDWGESFFQAISNYAKSQDIQRIILNASQGNNPRQPSLHAFNDKICSLALKSMNSQRQFSLGEHIFYVPHLSSGDYLMIPENVPWGDGYVSSLNKFHLVTSEEMPDVDRRADLFRYSLRKPLMSQERIDILRKLVPNFEGEVMSHSFQPWNKYVGEHYDSLSETEKENYANKWMHGRKIPDGKDEKEYHMNLTEGQVQGIEFVLLGK